MHVPSFVVGSLVSGTAFLIVDEQLSHRTRLSKKWALREMGEVQLKLLAEQIRSSRGNTKQLQSDDEYFSKSWNKAIKVVQDYVNN